MHKQVNQYYPFGLELANIGMTTDNDNKFKYNAKELEDDHNLYWYHYGARYYDPQLGRWHVVDPAEQYFSLYSYVGNNPLTFFDLNGEKGFYFGLGAGIGFGLDPGPIEKPNYFSASVIRYFGCESNGTDLTGSAVTVSPGGIFGGAASPIGAVFGLWFGDFNKMEMPTNSVGMNVFGISLEIIVDGTKSDLGFSDIYRY